MKIEIIDVMFWLVIAAIVAIALWLLHGSPQVDSALISVALFVATSEVMLWRKVFSLDKKTAVSFAHLKYDLQRIEGKIDRIPPAKK